MPTNQFFLKSLWHNLHKKHKNSEYGQKHKNSEYDQELLQSKVTEPTYDTTRKKQRT